MKKFVFTLIALVASTMSMFAGSKVTFVSGDASSINDKKVYIEYDYSKMQILDEDSKNTMSELEFCKMKGEDWVRDMGKDTKEAENWFFKTMKKKAKGFTVVDDKSQADVVLTLQPTTFSYGNPYAYSAFMSNDVKGFFVGQAYLTTKDNQSVAQLDIAKLCGDGGLSWTIQKNKVYIKVAEALAKAMK